MLNQQVKQNNMKIEKNQRIEIPVGVVEFNEGGNTIWIQSPQGGTTLRIKCTGKIKVDSCQDSPLSHCDIMVDGDINFCVSEDSNKESNNGDLIVEIINEKLKMFNTSLTDKGEINVRKFSKYNIDTVVEVINETHIAGESHIGKFINKVGSILYIKSLPEINQKFYHIRNILDRNNIDFHREECMVTLHRYVNSLKKNNTESQILEKLNDEVILFSRTVKNWGNWKKQMDSWTENIKK